MGGHAFMHHYQARMPTAVYEVVVDDLVARLKTMFNTVIVPPGLPGKYDHGDVDIYVGDPIGGKLYDLDTLKNTLGAFEFTKPESGNKSWTYFAIQWPENLLCRMPPRPKDLKLWTKNPETDGQNVIQIDLQQHMAPLDAEWNAFWSSYGNLRPILACILRKHGLLLQQKPDNPTNGLIMRIPELEKPIADGILQKGKKWIEVRLTADPSELLRFVGMLQEGQKWYDLDFVSEMDLARYICTNNRFFCIGDKKHYQAAYEDEASRYRNAAEYFRFFKYWAMTYLEWHEDEVVSGGQLPKTMTPHEVFTEALNFFPHARALVEDKIRIAKAEFEPKEFYNRLTRQLRILYEPEITTPEAYGTIFSKACLNALGKSDAFVAQVADNIAADEVGKAKLNGLVNARISSVIRRVKAIVAAAPVESEDRIALTALMQGLWLAGEYDPLLVMCLNHRKRLDQEQKDIEVANYKASQERRGKKAPEKKNPEEDAAKREKASDKIPEKKTRPKMEDLDEMEKIAMLKLTQLLEQGLKFKDTEAANLNDDLYRDGIQTVVMREVEELFQRLRFIKRKRLEREQQKIREMAENEVDVFEETFKRSNKDPNKHPIDAFFETLPGLMSTSASGAHTGMCGPRPEEKKM